MLSSKMWNKNLIRFLEIRNVKLLIIKVDNMHCDDSPLEIIDFFNNRADS
jgi:hypothetical protein